MKVALISLDQLWLDKIGNFNRCREIVTKAVSLGSKLVVLPEMTLTGYSLDGDIVPEDGEHSETLQMFTRLSAECGVNIVFGLCLQRRIEGKECVFNVLAHASETGSVSSMYSKFHPFSFAHEGSVITPGNETGFVEIAGVKLGASICYDLRFPMLFSIMAPDVSGAICIANWPSKRLSHWRALLTARAIENQMFMIGVNRIGTDGNKLEYEKSSMIVSPEGKILSPMLEGKELDIYDLDFNECFRYRNEFPTLPDAKFTRYAQVIKRKIERENEHGFD